MKFTHIRTLNIYLYNKNLTYWINELYIGSAAHGDLGDTSDPRTLIVEEFRIVFSPERNEFYYLRLIVMQQLSIR